MLSSPAGAFTDWHIDFGGSCAWYYIIQGSKTFVLAPPTDHNLRAFEQWACASEAQVSCLHVIYPERWLSLVAFSHPGHEQPAAYA